MFKNVHYNTRNSLMHIWEQNENGDNYRNFKWVPYVFVESDRGSVKTLEGKTVYKKNFKNYREYINFCKDNFSYEDRIKPEIQFLSEQYHGVLDEEMYIPKLRIYSIDIEVHHEKEFPKPEEAKYPIVLISIKDSKSGMTITFGVKEYTGNKDIKFFQCEDEIDLLNKFMSFMHKFAPDVITGWNCVSTDSMVFGINHIDTIESIEDDSILYKFPKSYKKKVEISFGNGRKIYASEDHIMPIVYADGGKYTNFNPTKGKNEWLKREDVKIKDIPIGRCKCFAEFPIHKNINKDIDISDDSLYTLGFIFTDGTLNDKKRLGNGYRIYQSDYELLETFDNFVTTKICGNRKKGYSRRIKHSLLKDFHHFIFDENGNKRLNVKEISRLSYRQFMIFLSGMLDGDGFISSNKLSICNFEYQLESLSLLCQWNGIFTILSKDRRKLRFVDIKYDDLSLRKVKRWGDFNPTILKRNSSQEISKIRFKKTEGKYIVRIDNIKYTDEEVEMIDIKTDTGYFNCNGVTVHNCYGFDMPYIINRCKVLFGEDDNLYTRLSPINEVRMWKAKGKFNKEVENVDIAGVTILDMMDLYKWYSPNKLESYTLDFVTNYELGEGKVDYSEYTDLRTLYYENWNLYVEYNAVDAQKVYELEEKLGYIKLVQALSLITRVPMKFYDVQTSLIEGILLTHYRRNGLCAPHFSGGSQRGYEAAFVKEPQVGKHYWVVDLDIASSYPSHIITLNMSPETYYGRILGLSEEEIINYTKLKSFPNFDLLKNDKIVSLSGRKLRSFNESLKKKILSVSPCGSLFNNTKMGIFPELERDLFSKRKETKGKRDENKKLLDGLDKDEKAQVKELVNQYNSKQLALKVLLNAVYGITAVPYSRYFNTNIAEAITYCGKVTIKAGDTFSNDLMNDIENESIEIVEILSEIGTYENKMSEKVDFIAYIDTDSIGGDSIIDTNIGNKKIEDLWKFSSEKEYYGNDRYFAILPGVKCNSFNSDKKKIEEKDIKYIMKHKVKKKMYRIKYKNKYVDVTEDHSIVVNRNGNYIDVKPSDIKEGDKIIIK